MFKTIPEFRSKASKSKTQRLLFTESSTQKYGLRFSLSYYPKIETSPNSFVERSTSLSANILRKDWKAIEGRAIDTTITKDSWPGSVK